MKADKLVASTTIFIGSFLVFLVQPMLGNFILPHFGGSSAVWVTSLCTFQTLLILGYAYAHVLQGRFLKWLHVFLLILAAILFNPLARHAMGLVEPLGAANPMLAIVVFLLLSVALPYVLVGANASFVQSAVATDKGSYRLYAISNAGSFAGLLCYPLVVERTMTISRQLSFYAAALAAYAVLLAVLLCVARRGGGEHRGSLGGSFSDRRSMAWLLLSATSCFLLDAVTAHLCMDVMPLPLMWCAILSVYLLTWVLAYTGIGSRIGASLWPVVIALVLFAVFHEGADDENAHLIEFILGFLTIFFGAWHVESLLYSTRPEVSLLTRYYFVIAVGGGIGGILASVVAPLVFPFVAEYPLALTLLFAVAGAFLWRRRPGLFTHMRAWHVAAAVLVVGFLALARSQIIQGRVVSQQRNFYGTVRVAVCGKEECNLKGADECVFMYNNGTLHGYQLSTGSVRGLQPTAYYTDIGGGMCLEQHPKRKRGEPLRAAFLGMGIGTLAAYGDTGDTFRFYEINPAVSSVATDPHNFTFVSRSDAKVEVVVDDARKALERESSAGEKKYDLIVVDVFTGDSIPPHMATREAVALYLRMLNEDGILAFHISNWHMNLWPIMKSIRDEFGLQFLGVCSEGRRFGIEAQWAYFSRREIPFTLDPNTQTPVPLDTVEDVPILTDDFHPMMRFLRNRWLSCL